MSSSINRFRPAIDTEEDPLLLDEAGRLRHPSTTILAILPWSPICPLFDLIDYAAAIHLDRCHCGVHKSLTMLVLNTYDRAVVAIDARRY